MENISDPNVTEHTNVKNSAFVNKPEVYTSEWLKKNTEVKWGLKIFLFYIVLLSFISMAIWLLRFNVEQYFGSYLLSIAEGIIQAMPIILAIYIVMAFIKRKPDAVFLAKFYVVVFYVVSKLLVFLVSETYREKWWALVGSLVLSVLFFLYLSISRNVKNVIPSKFRKFTAKDFYIVATVVLILLARIGYSAMLPEFFHNRDGEVASLVENTPLGNDEYTDGKIVFKKPTGFSCEGKQLNEELYAFRLKKDSSLIVIVSDNDNDFSYQNFEEYREMFRDRSFDKKYHEYADETAISGMNNNGDRYWLQSRKYKNKEANTYWTLAMLFSQKTSTVAIVSYYMSSDDKSVLEKLLNSIRFE